MRKYKVFGNDQPFVAPDDSTLSIQYQRLFSSLGLKTDIN